MKRAGALRAAEIARTEIAIQRIQGSTIHMGKENVKSLKRKDSNMDRESKKTVVVKEV